MNFGVINKSSSFVSCSMKGEDGVDEMKEDLNANKIMYAFIKVEDPKTSLPKFVLLNWQGESAPGTRDTIQCN